MKYIFVTGGVVSSLGKGLTAASLDEALARLKVEDPELERIVVLKFFGAGAHNRGAGFFAQLFTFVAVFFDFR